MVRRRRAGRHRRLHRLGEAGAHGGPPSSWWWPGIGRRCHRPCFCVKASHRRLGHDNPARESRYPSPHGTVQPAARNPILRRVESEVACGCLQIVTMASSSSRQHCRSSRRRPACSPGAGLGARQWTGRRPASTSRSARDTPSRRRCPRTPGDGSSTISNAVTGELAVPRAFGVLLAGLDAAEKTLGRQIRAQA
jgi:hypothetical protein